MSAPMHTPGPWSVYADMRTDVCRATGDELSYVAGWNIESPAEEIVGCEGIISGPTSEANARLIAAAPELLEALEEARRQLEYVDGRFPTGTTPAVLARINAAIAKARGAA